jgi:hypothetical protein
MRNALKCPLPISLSFPTSATKICRQALEQLTAPSLLNFQRYSHISASSRLEHRFPFIVVS